jgi:hypothetical protein
MSTRRKVGDWVWLSPNAGFVGESNRLRAEIQPETDPWTCCLGCGDPECLEWVSLVTEPDANGKRHSLYHVSECQMHSEKQEGK